jgi:lysophospholipase L1-like esterase
MLGLLPRRRFGQMLKRMTPSCRQLLCCVLLLYACVNVRGDLVLTNYTVANPLKVMAIGDSITDDCSINGAWRAPLQALLETNQFAFTFVGRQSSTAVGVFTKVRHEGYCGAVVAAPGVFPAHQYSDVNNYLQKIVPDALAIATNKPDVAMILIGANDIGRGREPRQVATNDMAALLNMIFSNAPNANVILAKASTLQNASIGSPLYGVYASNVMIYNATLQMVVNQRRALGQNVFLADMYSAVDYNTMFLSDHVHPSTLGLQAMAREWLTRLQTFTTRTDLVTTVLVNSGASWKYNDQGQDLGTNWAQPAFDDSSWSNGVARLGYGDPATATTVSYGGQPDNKFVTTYFRRSFVAPSNAVITNLNLRLVRADGVAFWLNGQEIYRTNLPAGPLAATNLALNVITNYSQHIFYPTNLPVSNLLTGTNWIAVEVHLSSVSASAMGFDMELIGTGYRPPSLSLTPAGDNNFTLSWSLSNGTNFSPYSTTNLAVPDSWTSITGSIQTNVGRATITQSFDSSVKFFRLQQP